MLGANSSLQQPSTVGHLENQIASALVLKSPSEYHFWFTTYVRYIVQEGKSTRLLCSFQCNKFSRCCGSYWTFRFGSYSGMEGRLRELCDDLLGPLYKSKSSQGWEPKILVSIQFHTKTHRFAFDANSVDVCVATRSLNKSLIHENQHFTLFINGA